jgi:MFS family permease
LARQRLVPTVLRGRVFSSYSTFAAAALSAGAFFGGLIATALGLRAPMVLGGPLLLILAYVAFRRLNAVL